jgi:hypothetical protein
VRGRPWLPALAWGAAAAASAQTNDHLFRSWAWPPAPVTARALGLAGAGVALPDDAGSALASPANLVTLVKTEASVAVRRRGAGELRLGDTVAGGTDLAFIGVAGRISGRWALAGYLAETRSADLRLAPRPLPDGLSDEGELSVTVLESGLSAGWTLVPGLDVGLRLAAARLSADGEYRREAPSQPTLMRVEVGGTQTRLVGSLGAAWVPGRGFRLAVAYHEGGTFSLERRAVSPFLGAVLDEGSTFALRQPGAFSAGASARLGRKVLLLAQVDRVRYGEVQAVLSIRQGAHARGDYRLPDAWEPAAGIEVSLPFSRVSAQFRAGLRGTGPAALSYQGGDAAEAASFPASERQLGWGLGASVVSAAVRLDVAVAGVEGPQALVASLARRF